MSVDLPAAERFIRTHAPVSSPPLCPELRLHLGGEVMALWEESRALLGPEAAPPYWAYGWPGGQALARCLLDDPSLVRGCRVLDFASGGGLHAIAALKAGAGSVLAAEIDPLARTALALNAELNGVVLEATGEDLIGRDEGWEVILTGDVCYERPLAERVMRWLRSLAARGALVLMGDQGRPYSPRDGLALRARYRVPTTRDLEGADEREAFLWQVL